MRNSCKSIGPICKSEEEDNYHFLLRCKAMRPEFDLIWPKLFSLIETKETFEADVTINFFRNLDDHNKVLLLTGGLKLPFQRSMSVSIARFIRVSVPKLVRIRERLVCSWHHHSQSFLFLISCSCTLVYESLMLHLATRLRNCNIIISKEINELRSD